MQRELGRRRLTAVTGAVGVGAAAIAALVGFTRPAPVHHAQASHAGSSTDTTSGDRTGHHHGQRRADGQSQQAPQAQQPPQSTDQGPDQVSSGS